MLHLSNHLGSGKKGGLERLPEQNLNIKSFLNDEAAGVHLECGASGVKGNNSPTLVSHPSPAHNSTTSASHGSIIIVPATQNDYLDIWYSVLVFVHRQIGLGNCNRKKCTVNIMAIIILSYGAVRMCLDDG